MSETLELRPINRFLVAVIIGAGVAIGVAPLMILIGRPNGWLIISLSSLLVAAITLVFLRRTTYHRPNLGEYLLAGLNAMFTLAFIGLLGMGLYYLLYALISGIEWLVQLFFAVEWDQANIAYLLTMVAAVPVYWIMAWAHADEITDDLTPETAGLRSPYYYLLTVDRGYLRQNLFWDLVVLIVLLVLGYFWFADWVFLVLFQIYLFAGSANFMNDNIRERIKASAGPKAEKAGAHPAQTAFSSLLEPGKRSAESSKRDRVIDLVAKIFTAAGWQVEKRPRTQDPTVDPLLVDIDLLATRNGSAMLGDVSYTEGGATFDDIQRPSAIIQAVWLLAEHRDLDPDDVGAGLIIVDARPDQKIGEICERLGITLILLDGTRVDEFLGIPEEDSEARARKAKELLNLPLVEEAIDV